MRYVPTPCIGQEQLTSLSASAGLANIPPYVAWALIKPRAQGIFLRLTGGTATSGDMSIAAEVPVEITSTLSQVRMLQQAAGAIVDVWYFG